jgi:plastocyanin
MSPLTNTIVLAIAGLATQTSASTIKVAVGKSGLTFAPDTVTASAGDVLEFHFYAKNHSVVMGDWTDACVPAKTGGFYSGFFPTAANTSNVRPPRMLQLRSACRINLVLL